MKAREQGHQRRRWQSSPLNHIVENKYDGFCVLDHAGFVLGYNSVFKQLIGASQNIRGSHVFDSMSITHQEALLEWFDMCQHHSSGQVCQWSNALLNQSIWVDAKLALVHMDDKSVFMLSIKPSEKSPIFFKSAHASKNDYNYNRTHDEISGLLNRKSFTRALDEAITAYTKSGEIHTCLYIDLDQFRIINDTCGDIAGDHLIAKIGNILQKAIHPKDTLARLGGDEFGILLHNRDGQDFVKFCEHVQALIHNSRFEWENQYFSLSASIGVVRIDDEMKASSQILSTADTACYIAKEEGRGRVYVYNVDDQKFENETIQYNCVSQICRAIDHEQFRLYKQKIMPLDDQSRGDFFEILIRMEDDDQKTIYPGHFLPTAERFNLINRIDSWVVDHTFKHFADHKQDLASLEVCCINLSAQSVTNTPFIHEVMQKLKFYQIPAEKICFEITETGIIANLSKAMEFIEAIKKAGCSFSLDDFGTGMSSFAYLKDLPVDFVKIDGLFIKDMLSVQVNKEIVSSINDISHLLGKKTVAEFVENDEILKAVKSIGINFAQGYGIGKPKPLYGKE